MIRQAVFSDLKAIETTYHEHFEQEKRFGAYTVFQEGIYPTKKDAENALQRNALYVYEDEGAVLGSMILDGRQPDEYQAIHWPAQATADRVKVIHLLLVRPRAGGKGVGSALVRYAVRTAQNDSCLAVRLDTGEQNTPAVSLYTKLGFQLIASSSMKVGGAIEHKKHLFFEKPL